MKRTAFNLVIAAMIGMSLSACHNSGTTTSPTPPPDQSRYETLPAKHYLVNASGTQTKMWAEFDSVNPLRGSTVVLGTQNCADPSSGCFGMSMTFGFDGIDNPFTIATLTGYFSSDGVNPNGGSIVNGAFWAPSVHETLPLLNLPGFPPKYIVVTGTHPAGYTGGDPLSYHDPAESGSASFLLDYH